MSTKIVPEKFRDRKIVLTETEREVLDQITGRHKLGRRKYGVGISYKQIIDPAQWCQEAIEECADMLQYLCALKIRLQQPMTDKQRKIK
jgi:hypothetical protein